MVVLAALLLAAPAAMATEGGRSPALLPLCDAISAEPSRHRRVAFNLAEPEDLGAVPSLQRAVQLCIGTVAAPRDRDLRGPVRRG